MKNSIFIKNMKKQFIMVFLSVLLFLNFGIHAAEININKATAEEIALVLNGIGHKKAVAIVEYRKKHGPFKSLEELTKVSGIGAKILEKNKNVIKLGASSKLIKSKSGKKGR